MIPHLDKVVHFAMFAALAFLMFRAISTKLQHQARQMLLVFFVCMAYGALMEYLQAAYFVGRDGDPLDWFADICGALAAIVFARQLKVNPAH
jgi:VanZ family protein